MKSISASSLAKSFLENPFLSSTVGLVLWLASVLSGSVGLMIVSGILVFGRPFLYLALINAEDNVGQPAGTKAARASSLRTSTACAR